MNNDLFTTREDEFREAILRLWTAGWHTARIARELGVMESRVANILPEVLAARRQARAAAARKVLHKTERRLGVAPVPA